MEDGRWNDRFSAGLNDRLSLLFLDLPTNARIVSLKAFASSFTLSAYTLNSPLAIIEQGSERQYGRKSVSWKDEGGSYWIGRVDRERVERWKRREERRKSRRVIVA
jgi:H3 lysine-79-specific histone-lysine N-methyltransferase